MLSLKNKKILFIHPFFHGYENHIFMEMRKLGLNLYTVPEKPSWMVRKWVVWLPLPFRVWLVRRFFFSRIAKLAENKFDILWLIRGEYLNVQLFQELENKVIINRKIMLQWDLIQNIPNALPLAREVFLESYSYSVDDTQKHPIFNYCHNFYLRSFESQKDQTPFEHRKYTISFVGCLYGKRLQIIKRIRHEMAQHNLPNYFHIFISSLGYWLQKWHHRKKDPICREDFAYSKLSVQECAAIYAQSKIVLDICNPGQQGIATRVYEALAAGAKVISNNRCLIKESYYDPNLIHIVEDDFTINWHDDFFKKPILQQIDIKSFRIDRWLQRILNNTVKPAHR